MHLVRSSLRSKPRSQGGARGIDPRQLSLVWARLPERLGNANAPVVFSSSHMLMATAEQLLVMVRFSLHKVVTEEESKGNLAEGREREQMV